MQGNDGEMHNWPKRISSTWLGITGALLILAVMFALWSQKRSAPVVEQLLPDPVNLTFSGPSLAGENQDQVAVRLHNFIVSCVTGDFKAAERYIDPGSFLAGQASAACGPVVSPMAQTGTTKYQFDRVATDRDVSSVYITAQQPLQVGERYIFFMRKVKGDWYFSTP